MSEIIFSWFSWSAKITDFCTAMYVFSWHRTLPRVLQPGGLNNWNLRFLRVKQPDSSTLTTYWYKSLSQHIIDLFVDFTWSSAQPFKIGWYADDIQWCTPHRFKTPLVILAANSGSSSEEISAKRWQKYGAKLYIAHMQKTHFDSLLFSPAWESLGSYKIIHPLK